MKIFLSLFMTLLLACSDSAFARDEVGRNSVIDACVIARGAFIERLEEKSSYKWEFSEYVSDIRNYSMGVAETDDRYIVAFRLIRKDFIGGSWFYEIDKNTMQISRSYGFK